MNRLSDQEWETINKIILDIYSEIDSQSLRENFMKSIRLLINYDIAEFSLGNNELQFYDSIEVNLISSEHLGIMERYLELKKKHGLEKQDWFFRYPYSYVISKQTCHVSPEALDNSKFNMIFMQSIQVKDCCTMTLWDENNLLSELSLYSADFDFSDKDIYILNQFKEHLARKMSFLLKKTNSAVIPKEHFDKLEFFHLTEREIQALRFLLTDMTNYSIACEMSISANTLKKHIGNIFHKMDIRTRAQLKNYFMQ